MGTLRLPDDDGDEGRIGSRRCRTSPEREALLTAYWSPRIQEHMDEWNDKIRAIRSTGIDIETGRAAEEQGRGYPEMYDALLGLPKLREDLWAIDKRIREQVRRELLGQTTGKSLARSLRLRERHNPAVRESMAAPYAEAARRLAVRKTVSKYGAPSDAERRRSFGRLLGVRIVEVRVTDARGVVDPRSRRTFDEEGSEVGGDCHGEEPSRKRKAARPPTRRRGNGRLYRRTQASLRRISLNVSSPSLRLGSHSHEEAEPVTFTSDRPTSTAGASVSAAPACR